MPTTKAAKKALKVSQKKRSRNRRYLDLFKESTKKLQSLLNAQDVNQDEVQVALNAVYSRVDTLEKKNILHKNAAARKKSIFAKSVSALAR